MILDAPDFWARLAEISFLNMLLSGDNAVVIALAVRALPGRERLLGQLGGTVGAQLGSSLAERIGGERLRAWFGLVILLVALVIGARLVHLLWG